MSNDKLKKATGQVSIATQIKSFSDYIESRKDSIAQCLPRHMTVERVTRLLLTEFTRNEDLRECEINSIYRSVLQASQLGLEIGVLGQAYLVPFWNKHTRRKEAQFIPGYKGLLSLARRSGDVTSIETNIVYENDTFDLTLGLETKVVHKPLLEGDRGKPRLVYGVANFKGGDYHFEWMTMHDVQIIRSRSQATSGPWFTDEPQMIRKTLIRRMANYLPMSIELANALAADDAADRGNAVTIDAAGTFVEEDGPLALDAPDGGNDAPAMNIPPKREPVPRQEPPPRTAGETLASAANAQPRQTRETEQNVFERIMGDLERATTLDEVNAAARDVPSLVTEALYDEASTAADAARARVTK